MARILIIEDDEMSQNLFARLLERRGHEVFKAGQGLKGLEIAQTEMLDLILLDLGLPDLDGTSLAGLFNRFPGDHAKIIAVTGRTGEDARRRALCQGCDGYLTKPIDIHTFGETVEGYLEAVLVA